MLQHCGWPKISFLFFSLFFRQRTIFTKPPLADWFLSLFVSRARHLSFFVSSSGSPAEIFFRLLGVITSNSDSKKLVLLRSICALSLTLANRRRSKILHCLLASTLRIVCIGPDQAGGGSCIRLCFRTGMFCSFISINSSFCTDLYLISDHLWPHGEWGSVGVMIVCT